MGVLCLSLGAHSLGAAQYSLLHAFAGAPSDAGNPYYGSVTTDGTTLYGMTLNGGATNRGALFKAKLDGSGYQVLHSFTGRSLVDVILGNPGGTNDGANPYGSPVLLGSTLYGMSLNGGTNGLGCVFQINTDGSGFALLHSFGGLNDGSTPYGSLTSDGTNLFGMTSMTTSAEGTIFTLSTNGAGYRTLHVFQPGGDGASPQGSLTLSGSTLFGTTLTGGTIGQGTIFRIGTDGTGYKLLHSFTTQTNDGGHPYGAVLVAGSTLYGTSDGGGDSNLGVVYRMDMDGTNFQVLHSFASTNTFHPYGDLVLSNSTLYGTTSIGGPNGLGFGTVYQVNTDGSGFGYVHNFSYPLPATDGSTPISGLLLLGSKLYGMTYAGGSGRNVGCLYALDLSSSGGGGSGEAGIKVTLAPAGAISAGAQWQVDGGAFQNSGAVVAGLVAGSHTVSFKPVSGWITPAPQVVVASLGATNVLTGTYIAGDTSKPTLTVTAPTAGQRVLTNVFTAAGTAKDNFGVHRVFYQFNGSAWGAAATTNHWVNWTIPNLALSPGTNTLSVYAVDGSGNASATNTVSFVHVLTEVLTVTLNGLGTVTPNLDQQALELGNTYLITAKPAKGFAFVNWTGGLTTNLAKLKFTMVSNLVLTANFKDVGRPVNVILSPKKNQTLTSANPVVTGKAKDNVGVEAVWLCVNGSAWFAANLLDGTNWSSTNLSASLMCGPNIVSAFAVDAAGNASLTNTIPFRYVVQPGTDWAPDVLNGLLASWALPDGSPEIVGFDPVTFAQTGTSAPASAEDFGGGIYSYVKTGTNQAELSCLPSVPLAIDSGFSPVTLVFTNHYAGYFTNADDGYTGGFSLSAAADLVPVLVFGKTLTIFDESNLKTATIKLGTGGAFTKTPANGLTTGSSSGTWGFMRLSPVCGLFRFDFTDAADAGQTIYVQTSFTNLSSGISCTTSFGNGSVFQHADAGHFTLK